MDNENENCIFAEITEENAGKRLDVVVSALIENTRSAAEKLCESQAVKVNSKPEKKNYKLRVGDKVGIILPEPEPIEAQPENIPVDIVYEDDDLLVVNKRQGTVVHPAPGNPNGTLVNALLYHCAGRLSSVNGKIRPGIVHRIDKDTSGLLIVAKTDRAHKSLAKQIEEHSFVRRYETIVIGCPKEDAGTVDAPIGRNPNDRKKMAVTEKNSKRAITHYRVTEKFKGYSELECELETGRTHQIRVHMSYIGHPVLGDPLYCPDEKRAAKFSLVGQCLNAKYIEFTHPVTGERISFTTEKPEYFKNTEDKLRKLSN